MTDPKPSTAVCTNATPLYALLLDGKGGARSLSASEIDAWQPAQGVLWLHFDYTQPETQDWLAHSDLDPLVCDALLTENTRPRVTPIGDSLLIALRGVNLNPGADPEDMVSIRLFASEHRIVSSRKRKLTSVSGLIEALQAGQGPVDVADFLVSLASRLVDRMGDVVEDIEETLSGLELELFDTPAKQMREELAEVRRETITLRRYFGPQRDALNQLQTERLPWFPVEQRLLLREVSDQLLRHIEDLDVIRERTTLAQEQLISQQSDLLNQRMYILSMISAVFLPLGFLTGLLGINVGGIPGSDNPYAFGLFLIFLSLLVAGQIWLFRRQRWL